MSADFWCRVRGHKWRYTYDDDWPYRCERCWWTPEWKVRLIPPPPRHKAS